MKIGRRNIRDFLADRAGSGTTKLAATGLAVLLASLIVGDELARFAEHAALPKMNLAGNAPRFRDREIDSTPTGAIPSKSGGAGRTPCGERDD